MTTNKNKPLPNVYLNRHIKWTLTGLLFWKLLDNLCFASSAIYGFKHPSSYTCLWLRSHRETTDIVILIHSYLDELDHLNCLNLTLCKARIQEWTDLIQKPTENILIPDVLCQFILLHRHKYQLEKLNIKLPCTETVLQNIYCQKLR